MRSSATSVLALALLIALTVAAGRPHAQRPAVAPETNPTEVPVNPTGTILGNAWRSDGTPLADGSVRLRSVQTGLITGNAATTTNGEFRFDAVESGSYVVELITERGWVLGLGRLFSLGPDETVAIPVRLGTKTPWFSGFFSNAASGALVAASRLGVTAVGSNGPPASPQ
jgi:hypothetical protein